LRLFAQGNELNFLDRAACAPAFAYALREEINMIHLFVAMLIAVLMPTAGYADADSRIAKSMDSLKALTAKLGAPKLEGRENVGAKSAPASILARQRSTTISILLTPSARKTLA
jgi:hypothetical protein